MEYSKEDLMEAKRQILGVGENMGTEESKKIWEENAQFWDNAMGDESNEFHREVVRPKVTELLSPNPADYILDIACGNGNYSSYLAQRGASVVAFDYSKKMIELAKRRQSQYAKQIEFCVADATDRKSILELKRNRAFTKAVSNMAIMDITDIEPLLMAVYELLQESGIFVFATQHPCFVTLTEKYMTPHSYYDIAIEGQPKEQIYYHRSIQDIFNLCFRAGFVIDGFYEECFKTNKEIPMVRSLPHPPACPRQRHHCRKELPKHKADRLLYGRSASESLSSYMQPTGSFRVRCGCSTEPPAHCRAQAR